MLYVIMNPSLLYKFDHVTFDTGERHSNLNYAVV